MWAQAFIELILIGLAAYLIYRYIVEPFILDKYYPEEEEPAVDAESLHKKIELLEQKKAELEVLKDEVDVTSELLTINTAIDNLKFKLEKLEKGASIDE